MFGAPRLKRVMARFPEMHGTTILAVRQGGHAAIAGDGQVTLWRTDRVLRRLEAFLVVADRDAAFLLSGAGDVIAPDDGLIAVGSGGPYALAAAADGDQAVV